MSGTDPYMNGDRRLYGASLSACFHRPFIPGGQNERRQATDSIIEGKPPQFFFGTRRYESSRCSVTGIAASVERSCHETTMDNNQTDTDGETR